MELYVTEKCDLFSVSKTKEEINKWVRRYNVKCEPKVSPMGQVYTEVSGTFPSVVCFLGEVFDMNVCAVILLMGEEHFWCKGSVDKER